MATQRRRIGLRARVISSFAILSALLSLFLSSATYFLIQASTLQRREVVAKNLAFSNARLVRQQLLELPSRTKSDTALPYADFLPRRLVDGTAVLRIDGEIYPSNSSFGTFDPEHDIPIELEVAVQNHTTVVQRTHKDGEPVLFIGIPLRLSALAAGEVAPADGEATDTTQAGPATAAAKPAAGGPDADWAEYYEVTSLKDIETTFDNLVLALAAAGVLTTVAGALVGRWVSKRVLAPLSDVNSAVHALATMSFDTKLPATRDPDLAPLVSTFNHTVAALQERIDRDGRFASDVSHELRSPLTTLTNSIGVLERYHDDLPEPAQRAVHLLTQEFERFQQLVGDLLEISRFDAGAQRLERAPLVIGEFVRNAARMTCPEEVPITIDPDLEEAVIMADKRRLVQVLQNLAVNAERYAGGVTDVTVTRARGGVEIAVSDNGPGVPLPDRIRIFDRFARGVTAGNRGNDGGTGLGLALVSEHVRLHGGSVRVEDRLDGEPGARFVVYLPATPVSIYDSEADFEAAGIGADL